MAFNVIASIAVLQLRFDQTHVFNMAQYYYLRFILIHQYLIMFSHLFFVYLFYRNIIPLYPGAISKITLFITC